MSFNPTATMTFRDYEVLDVGVRCHFESPNPGPGENSDYYIILSVVDVVGKSLAQLTALAKAALNEKLLATGISDVLDPLIGQNIVLDGASSPPLDPTTGPSDPVFITPWSPISLGTNLAALAVAAPVSTAWGTNNLARGVPFTLQKTITVVKGFWYNGATLGSNVDVGIYNNSASKLCSTGSVAQAGTNALQEAVLTGTLTLTPGRYYLALSLSVSTGTIFSAVPNVNLLKSLGAFQAASSFPLPATATPAVVSAAILPYFGVSLRSLVV